MSDETSKADQEAKNAADPETLGLDEAYAVATPDDNRKLYAKWSESYDADFIAQTQYVYHHHVVAALLDREGLNGDPEGAILDVGCGTGIVGVALRGRVPNPIDGVDISPEMMEQAASKRDDAGAPVYRNLFEADLTRQTDLTGGLYQAIISAGTFTHGHLGPEPIDELIRTAAPGAICAIGVNAEHWTSMGFEAWFAARVADGKITAPELVDVPIYDAEEGDHAADRANAVLFRVH